MAMNENRRSISSHSQVKNPPPRRSSRKAKHSRSSGSILSSTTPQRDNLHGEGSVARSDRTNGEVDRQCECGPDLYTRVLGPTADETILTGLQTVIDLCNKLRVCGDKEESPEEEPERESLPDVPERDSSPPPPPPPVAKQASEPKIVEEPNPKKEQATMQSAGFQVTPSMKADATQTAPYPEMVSEILQTIGLTPEQATKIVQTSFMSIKEPEKPLPEPKKTSLASIFMQTSEASLLSAALQTTYPDLVTGFAQTSDSLLPLPPPAAAPAPLPRTPTPPPPPKTPTPPPPIVEEKVTPSPVTQPSPVPIIIKKPTEEDIPPSTHTIIEEKREPSTKSIKSALKSSSEEIQKSSVQPLEATIPDEHKCISPPEPPQKSKTCKCCRCSSSSNLQRDSSDSAKGSVGKKTCICGDKSRSKRSRSSRSSTSVPGDQEQPVEVKFAVTRISKFKEFTTFEIMRSTKNQPSKMPKTIEGVFVLKKGEEAEKGKRVDEANGKKKQKETEKVSSGSNGKSINSSRKNL